MAQNAKIDKIIPSSFELVGLVFLSIFAVIIGNSHQLLNYYGLESSNQVIGHNAGTAVSHGLGKLDNFSFTDEVVTFLIWSLVGVFCFSVVRALITVYQEVERDEQLSSNKYVHPSTFTRAKFWRQVIADFVVLVMSLVIMAGLVYGLIGFVLPTALAYSRTFLLNISLSGTGALLLGIAIVYVWLVFLDLSVRLVFHHRQITQS